MHHYLKLWIGLLVASGWLSSCVDTIGIEFPPHQPRPVINALFTPDSLWKVEVTTSKSLRQEANYDTIANATIEIFEGDIRVDSLVHTGEGRYQSGSEHYPQEGKEYTLKFSAPGYPECSATDRVPILPEIKLVSVDTVPASSLFYFGGEKVVVATTINDAPAADYYYTLTFNREDGYVSYRQSYHSPPINTFDFGDRAMFSDRVFNGKTHALVFDFELFNDERTYLDIGIVSSQYFQYAQSYSEHLDDQVAFLATPEDVYSNVEGGFGIFAAYYSQTFVVRP